MRGQTSYWPFWSNSNEVIPFPKLFKNETKIQRPLFGHHAVTLMGSKWIPSRRPAIVLCSDIIRKRTVDCGKKGSQVQIGTYQLSSQLHPRCHSKRTTRSRAVRQVFKGKLRCGDKNKNLFVRRHKDDIKLIRRANSLGLWFARCHRNQWQNCVYNVCRLNLKKSSEEEYLSSISTDMKLHKSIFMLLGDDFAKSCSFHQDQKLIPFTE